MVRDTSSRNAATEVYSTPIPVQENEITIENLAYRAVQASAIDTGAVSSQKFAVGTFLPAGEGIQRVPAPMRDYTYWIDVIDGDVELHRSGIHADEDILNVSADPTGVTMTPTASAQSRIYLTGRLRRPVSSSLYIDNTIIPASSRGSGINGAAAGVSATWTRFGTYTNHNLVVGDTVAVTASARTVTTTLVSFPGLYSDIATVVITAGGHGVAVGDDVTITTSGASLPTYLPTGNYTVLTTSSSTFTVKAGVVGPATSSNPTGTAVVALPAGFMDGTYEVKSVFSSSAFEIELASTRGQLTAGTSTAGTATAAEVPFGSVRIVWWATDELATNYRYIYPGNKNITKLTSTTYEASAVVITVNGGTGGTTNKATLTLSAAHDMQVGELVNVTGTAGAASTASPLDGQFTITGITTTSPYSISWDTSATITNTAVVTGVTSNGTTITYTAANTFVAGQLVTVTGVISAGNSGGTAGLKFNLTNATVATASATQFTVTNSTTDTYTSGGSASSPNGRILVASGANLGRAALEVYDYAVYVELAANSTSALISQANVFEVVGATNSTSGGNSAQLAPNGLSLLGSSGTGGNSVALSLTTDSDTVMKVQQYSVDDQAYRDTATIYSDGTISGVLLKGDELNIDGINVVDTFATVTRNGGTAYSATVSMLNRLPRGIVYHGKWDTPATITLTGATAGAIDFVLATGSFTLDDQRAYQVSVVMAGLRANNQSNTSAALYFELVMSLTKPTTSGTWPTNTHQLFLVPVSTQATVSDFTAYYQTTTAVSDVTDNYRLPPNVPIYWAVIVHTAGAASVNPTLTSVSSPAATAATALVVTDVGTALLNSANAITSTYVGALETAGGAGTTTYTATKTIAATETGYWDNYGRGTYGTSDPYANQYSLYQGNPGTASGTKKSAIEFPALGLPSGATITGMRLYLKNTSTYDGSCSTKVAAHGTTELGTTLPTARTAPAIVSRTYSSGEAAWITLPSSWYSEWAAGTSKGVLMGITNTSTNAYDSTISNYGYFQGVGTGMSYPPKLEVTYTYTA